MTLPHTLATLLLLASTLLTGCGTAHSLSELDEKSVVTFTELDGTYEVTQVGHLPSNEYAGLYTDGVEVDVGGKLHISTPEKPIGNKFSLCLYTPDSDKDKTEWVFRLHKIGDVIVMAWYGELGMNFMGKGDDGQEPAPVFQPVYLLRFEAYGNPLKTIKIKAYKHTWLVKNAKEVQGVDAIKYHRQGEAFQTINGSPKAIEKLLALAEKDEANALDGDYLLTLKRIADLPTDKKASKLPAKNNTAKAPKPPEQAVLAGATQQQWAQRFKTANAHKVNAIFTKQTPLAVRVRIGDRYLSEKDDRWQIVADKLRRAGYRIDTNADRGIEVWQQFDVELLSSGRLKWKQYLTTTIASATVDGLVFTASNQVSHRRVALGHTHLQRYQYYTSSDSKEQITKKERADNKDHIRQCTNTLLGTLTSMASSGVPLGELTGDNLTSHIRAADKVLGAKPIALADSYGKPAGVRIDGTMPDFTGLGLMREKNNSYLESQVGKIFRNKGVKLEDDGDARSPQVLVDVEYNVTKLHQNVKEVRIGFVIAKLREPSCLVTAADGTPVWVTATAAMSVGMDNYDIKISGRYGLSLIAQETAKELLKD